MVYGVRLFNDAGKLAFSADNSVLQFLGKWSSGLITDASVGSSFYRVTFAGVTGGYVPVVFVGTSGGNASMNVFSLRDLSGGVWEAVAAARVPSNSYNTPGVLDFYVFTPPAPRTPAPGEYGMRFFDASGRPTLDTGRRLLKIAGYGLTTTGSGAVDIYSPSVIQATGVSFGSIPANWATSAQVVGYAGRALFDTQAEYWQMGVAKINAGTFGYYPNAMVGWTNELLTSDQYKVDSNNYVMFIDTDIYNATTGTF